jgi:uncharacterized protein
MDTIIRLTYDFNTLIIPVALVGLALWPFLAWRRRTPQRRSNTLLFFAAAGLFLLRVYATHIEPRNLQIREVTIDSAKVSRPLRILHISNIQSAAIDQYEESVFAKIGELNPDLLLHTGDLLQPQGDATYESELPKLAQLFATVCPPLGKFSVDGESDGPIRHLGPDQLGGLQFLRSDYLNLQDGDLHIRLFGLSLEHNRTRHATPVPRIKAWLEESPPNALNIVMGHRPDYITRLLELPVDLCLAGHTHGGHVRAPFYGAIVTSSGAPREWARGYRVEGKTRFNVSAGIGAGHNKGLPSIRFNCPPEMTVIHIVPAGGA